MPIEDILIWRCGDQALIMLGEADAIIASHGGLLAAEEMLDRGERRRLYGLRHLRRRGEYIASRLLAREAASRHLGGLRDSFSIDSTVGQPPVLVLTGMPVPGAAVSISHSEGWCAVAVGSVLLGVDVQRVQGVERWRRLTTRIFSPSETAWASAAPLELVAKKFTEVWSLKEASAKAYGSGIRSHTELSASFEPLSTPPEVCNAWTLAENDDLILCLYAHTDIPRPEGGAGGGWQGWRRTFSARN